jgi:type II secretory pathway pseudopilin PulG
MKTQFFSSLGARGQAGMTLTETLVSVALTVLTISGTINGYILSTNRAEWSAQSLAAHSMVLQRLEQVRAAKWDTAAYPPVDQVTSDRFPAVTNVLDLPVAGTNIVMATVFTTISTISTAPPLKMVRVDCIWPYMSRGFFTNTVRCYRAPDQ